MLSSPLCSHTSTALPCRSLQNKQRGPQSMWFVVWAARNFGSQAEYLGLGQLAALPFFLLLNIFVPPSNCPFLFLCLLLLSGCLSIESICVWAAALLPPSTLAGCWTSLPSVRPLPLSKYLFGGGFFSLFLLCGASKRGTKGEKTFCSTCWSDVWRKES